jgi:hypothetical protein
MIKIMLTAIANRPLGYFRKLVFMIISFFQGETPLVERRSRASLFDLLHTFVNMVTVVFHHRKGRAQREMKKDP